MANDTYLRQYLERFSKYKVAVIGDLMLDRYIIGKANRISEEAPVPVIKIDHETKAMGGAANVVANLIGLGSGASAFGFVGNDEHGDSLKGLMADAGAVTVGVIKHPSRTTAVKTRVMGNHQQVVRIDHEDTSPYANQESYNELRSNIIETLQHRDCDAVIFEDYAKGLLNAEFIQELNDIARQNNILTLLDPHPSNNFQTRNLGAITPNRAEAFGLSGIYQTPPALPLTEDKNLLQAAEKLLHGWGIDQLLITLGADGMALFSRAEKQPVHIPTKAQAVYDVSGAGDTVTAAFLLGMLAGAPPAEAASLANHAAGIVVGKVGTLPVQAEELSQNLELSYEE